MTNFYTLKSITTKFITSAGALALVAGIGLGATPPAYAGDCLLDTNNDGDADSNIDTVAGANSNSIAFRLACGEDATATGASSTAVGHLTEATGNSSTAVGKLAKASTLATTALGNNSWAGGNSATAVGEGAIATGFQSSAFGRSAHTPGSNSTAIGFAAATSTGDNATAVGHSATTSTGNNATAVGYNADALGSASSAFGATADASGSQSTAIGYTADAAGGNAIALGYNANASSTQSTALGAFTSSSGINSTALGFGAVASGNSSTAIGPDTSGDAGFIGASAQGSESIVIGADASDAGFDRAILIGKDTIATEADQVIIKSADTFTILGNGDVGLGTAAPLGNLDINSGAADTTLLLSNTSAQWELKSKASTGRLNFKNLIAGGVPFKLGPSAVNSLLSVGTMADDLVEVRGELMVEGNVDVTGTLTTGGPTCGGGCDAVFDADYDLPSIEEHAAAMYANNYLPEIGPTVPKAAINVSERMGTMLNELEKAHIYIAQNHREKQQMQRQIKQQAAELKIMKQQITLLMNP